MIINVINEKEFLHLGWVACNDGKTINLLEKGNVFNPLMYRIHRDFYITSLKFKYITDPNDELKSPVEIIKLNDLRIGADENGFMRKVIKLKNAENLIFDGYIDFETGNFKYSLTTSDGYRFTSKNDLKIKVNCFKIIDEDNMAIVEGNTISLTNFVRFLQLADSEKIKLNFFGYQKTIDTKNDIIRYNE